jgi:hypothetical protein
MMELSIIRIRCILLVFMGLALINSGRINAQNLENLLEAESKPEAEEATATFKSTRIINGHSIERMKKNQLEFRISHRFGQLNSGGYEFFGLDQSVIHFSLEYGLTNWLELGVGRGSFEKTVDGFAKASILRQTSGAKNIPFHLSVVSSIEVNGLKWDDPARQNFFSSRLTYVGQVLIARKFSNSFSLQLTPTYVHRNLVTEAIEPNDLYALGAGGRYKLSKRISVNAEYFYVYRGSGNQGTTKYFNPLAVGVDIETGGHVFQIMLTNSRGMREGGFIGKTAGDWANGGIHPGFNISRTFSF